MWGVILATVPLLGLGLFLVLFGLFGVVNYFGWRYGRFSRDASGFPTGPLQRGWYKADRFWTPLFLAGGCVGVVLLIASAVKYLIHA
jgi:hypothetical protein